MRAVYTFLVNLAWFHLRIISRFQPKIKLFVHGRQQTFPILETSIKPTDKVIWMHTASLGEYEQGLPLLEALKEHFSDHKLLLSFFSPSGYEVKKDKTPADVVVYLPMDTAFNSERFLKMTNPKLAIFIKYEIWPNYLSGLSNANIPTLLVSGIFSKKQVFFKWYGGFMRKALNTFTHFFVQEKNSEMLLHSIGFDNVKISGDTRFDRVSQILERDNNLEFMNGFKGNNRCFVAGSTWPEDEAILVDYINITSNDLKFVIAPHNIKAPHIEKLKNAITKKVGLYSQVKAQNLEEIEVLIVDTIGLLTKIYSYANIAYVGGGFATGLHNTLEPAVFGIPVIIGPNYSGFNEAMELVNKGGLLSIGNRKEFGNTMEKLLASSGLPKEIGLLNGEYIKKRTGATHSVLKYIQTLI